MFLYMLRRKNYSQSSVWTDCTPSKIKRKCPLYSRHVTFGIGRHPHQWNMFWMSSGCIQQLYTYLLKKKLDHTEYLRELDLEDWLNSIPDIRIGFVMSLKGIYFRFNLSCYSLYVFDIATSLEWLFHMWATYASNRESK